MPAQSVGHSPHGGMIVRMRGATASWAAAPTVLRALASRVVRGKLELVPAVVCLRTSAQGRRSSAAMESIGPRAKPRKRGWTFITNHAQVLLAIAHRPQLRVAEIAEAAEITERYAY